MLKHITYAILIISFINCTCKSQDKSFAIIKSELIEKQLAILNKEQSIPYWSFTYSSSLNEKNRIEYHQRNNKKLLKFTEGVLVRSSAEIFALKRQLGNESYALIMHKPKALDNDWKDAIRTRFFCNYPLSAFDDTTSLLDLINNSTFNILAAVDIDSRLFRVDYNYQSQLDLEQDKNTRINFTGSLFFDKRCDWILVKASRTADSTPVGQMTYKIERGLEKSTDGFTCKSIDLSYYSQKIANSNYTANIKYGYELNHDINDDVFQLSHYNVNLQTDDTYEDHGFNWPLWGGLGVGCIVLSLLLAWVVRRRNRLKNGD